MTDTDVAFLLYYRSYPYDRHDLYLPSIPTSLQTLDRCECAAASALAPHDLRIISPLTFYLNLALCFLRHAHLQPSQCLFMQMVYTDVCHKSPFGVDLGPTRQHVTTLTSPPPLPHFSHQTGLGAWMRRLPRTL